MTPESEETVEEFAASFERLWAIYVTMNAEQQRSLTTLLEALAEE